MINSRITKLIAIVLLGAMSTSMLFSQYDVIYDTPAPVTATPMTMPQQVGSASQGLLDGERDAKGNMAYGCGGFACNVFGFLAAALSNPQPSAAVVNQLAQSKGADYTNAYKAGYAKKAKNQNMLYAGIGWVVGTAVLLTYFYSDPIE